MPVYAGRRRGTYRVTVFAHNRQHEWIVEMPSKAEAREFEARKRIEFVVPEPVTRTRSVPAFSTFCRERYAPHAVAHLGVDTWNKVRRYQVDTLSKHLGAVRLDSLSYADIEGYKAKRLAERTRRGKPPLASSVNNELRVLKTMLRWGREDAKLPIPVVKITMLPTAGKRRVHAWTDDEVRRVFAAAADLYPDLVPLLAFLLNTGCRKGEARNAEWSWIDFKAGMLRIPVTESWHPKDKDAREVPLSDSLLVMLRALPRRSPQWLFPNALRRMYACFPEESYRAITKRAGVTGGPHTTRHTYASHFLQKRPDLPLLAEVLGHSTTKVTELYAHMLPGHLDRARNAVDMAPPSRLWRPTLAKTHGPLKTSKKTHTRH